MGLTFCVSTFYFSINTYTNEYSETHYLFMEDTGINKSNLPVSEASLQELSIGDDNAPITIIEYASMTCSHCADFHTETYPDLKEDYIEKGQVKFIFREFPLDKLSMATSMLARCVDNSISLAFIDILFQNRNKWYSDNAITELKNLSKQAGLSSEDFDQCLNNQGLLDQLIMQKENAVKGNRELMGATNPKDAEDGTIRKKYGISIDKNSVHGSDSVENAKIEISFFFKV